MKSILFKAIILFIPFTISGQCKLDVKADKFTGEQKIKADFPKWFEVIKYISSKDTTFYLLIENEGVTSNYGAKGVIVLFDDGTKLEWPAEKVDCKFRAGVMYDFTSFIRLNKKELNELATKKVKATRLYIYDRDISEKKALKLQEQIKCLLN